MVHAARTLFALCMTINAAIVILLRMFASAGNQLVGSRYNYYADIQTECAHICIACRQSASKASRRSNSCVLSQGLQADVRHLRSVTRDLYLHYKCHCN